MPALRSRKAFTFIELALVLLLTTTLAALCLPQLKNKFYEVEVKTACFNLLKLVHYAHEKSILERRRFELRFDFEGGRYRLMREEGEKKFNPAGGRAGKTASLPASVSFAGSKDSVVFYPDGRSDAAEITVRGKSGEAYRLKMSGFGRVDLREWAG